MSGGGGGSSNTTQTTKIEPPPQVQPYLDPFMSRANDLSLKPYQGYTGNQIAGFTPDQLAGFDMARLTANQSQGNLAGATGHLNDTIGGQYLNYSPGTNALLGQDNPYLQSAIDATHGDISRTFGNSVFNNTDAMMARSGAFGGSAWQQAQSENARQMTNELGRTSNDMRMADYGLQAQLGEADLNRKSQNHQAERAMQMQAARMLPGMAQAGYANSQALLGIGDAQQAMDQGGLDLAYQRWMQEQNAPYQNLDVLGNAIRTLMGSGGTTSATGPNPYQRNGTASALGGAMGGAGLAGAMGASLAGAGIAGPWGLAVGAGLGLLGGML